MRAVAKQIEIFGDSVGDVAPTGGGKTVYKTYIARFTCQHVHKTAFGYGCGVRFGAVSVLNVIFAGKPVGHIVESVLRAIGKYFCGKCHIHRVIAGRGCKHCKIFVFFNGFARFEIELLVGHYKNRPPAECERFAGFDVFFKYDIIF